MTSADPSAGAPLWRALPSGDVGHWRWHVPSRTIEIDEACARIYGALPGETPAQTWMRVVHPADRAHVMDPALRFREEVQVYRIRQGDSAPRYVLSRLTHVGDGTDGTGDGWLAGVVLDVTASHEADVRAVVALESMTDAFIACDDAFRVTYVNSSAEALLARTRTQLLGRAVWETFPHLVGTVLEDSYRRAATGEVVTFEWVGATPGSWITSDVHPSTEGLYVYLRDTTERHRATAEQQRLLAELEHQATHDPLTGLAGSVLAGRRVTEHLASSPSATASLVCVDLDRFSLVNDTLGRTTGDRLLREVASRLAAVAPPGALVCRSAGDEFLLVLLDTGAAATESVARRALAAVREPVRVERQELHVTASAGLAGTGARSGPDAGAEHLLRDVDIALHEAKRTGRDRLVWCDASLQAAVAHRMAVEHDLRQALRAGDQLRLHYQPSFSLATGAPTGAEALLRWQHPTRGLVPPSEVIPVAEDSGLVLPLGDWVVATAAQQALAWADVPGLTTWFNVAPRQLAAGDVAGTLIGVLLGTGLPPHRLGVEVTESVLADGSPAGEALQEVRELGVKIAIDDFGTGYSSLSRLLAFPVDVVKIDRSFVTACRTPAGSAVLEGIVNLAHGIGASVIAEGVETWEELAVLRGTSCDAVTGFLLGRPGPATDPPRRRARLSPPVPPGLAPGSRAGARGDAARASARRSGGSR